ncbi:MAG: type III-A CRISPR-associated protein Csm2 [Bacteroidales bacterium 36-12]|nr:MAG: type III-A CRISPR-associated protein Csm2 [Bacteroidales bacterium 36-12]
MSKYWKEFIKTDWIQKEITPETINYTEKFGKHLAKKDDFIYEDQNLTKPKTYKTKNGEIKNFYRKELTTSQLRKFFGEVKRQQVKGYNRIEFLLLKPKLAYAVGRVGDADAKINDFNDVISNAVDNVKSNDDFKRFIKIFEAIVAYHKSEE